MSSPVKVRFEAAGEDTKVCYRTSLGDLVDGPLKFGLTSPILQSSQTIALATDTAWTDDASLTAVAWELQCETAAGSLGLGDVARVMDSGCDCVCDVDGMLRTCGGTPCGE